MKLPYFIAPGKLSRKKWVSRGLRQGLLCLPQQRLSAVMQLSSQALEL